MKNRKWLLLMTLALMTVFFATGCSDSGNPTKSVEAIFKGYVETDAEMMTDHIDDDEYTPFLTVMDMPPRLGDEMVEKMKLIQYKVIKEVIAEDEMTATVDVEITYQDLGTAMAAAYQKIVYEETEGSMVGSSFEESGEYKEKTYYEFLANEVKEKKETLTLHMVKVGKTWKYAPTEIETATDPFYNILTGNMLAYIEAISLDEVVE